MIHSLYSHREIFLRELISNASDANDKLRFLALAEPALLGDEPELGIWIDSDAKAGTLTIRDNGIGMTREEAVAHLGTIAKSGTAEFFQRLTRRPAEGRAAHRPVRRRLLFGLHRGRPGRGVHAAAPAHAGSRGRALGISADGEFTVETVDCPQRGTRVVLHLKEDARSSPTPGGCARWCGAIPTTSPSRCACRRKARPRSNTRPSTRRRRCGRRPRTEINDEEYRDFYRHITHDGADPLTWSHNRVEGKREYTSLLYVPARAPFDLWQRDAARGLKLYVRRVFIMDDAEQFLPLYLRFIKGVVDSSDLPLNVSRELLQQTARSRPCAAR